MTDDTPRAGETGKEKSMETIKSESQTDAVRQAEVRGMNKILAISTLIAVVTLSVVLLAYAF